MYKILFLNEADDTICGRAYGAFVSAYCLARLGHTVLYISDRHQDFINQFYEGPIYSMREMADEGLDKRQASLPPSLQRETLDYTGRPDALRDLVDEYGGRPDMIWFSGGADTGAYVNQVALTWRIPAIHADILTLSPCVNEAQLARMNYDHDGGIVAVNAIITDGDLLSLIEAAETVSQRPPVTIIGRYVGQNFAAYRKRYPKINIIQKATDRARLRALSESVVMAYPFHTSRNNIIAEAMACGTPVVILNPRLRGDLLDVYGYNIRYDGNIEHYFSDSEFRDSIGAQARQYAKRNFGYGNRMMGLHQLIKRVMD